MTDMSGTASTADTRVAPALHERHKEWLAARGIQSDTAEAAGLTTKQDSRGNWLVFPYRLDGRLVNRKYRLTSEKQHQMDTGGTLCLWNAECLRSPHVAKGGSVIITEGEFDALIAMECGFHSVVSVPNGAPSERIDDPVNSNRYRFLWESKSDLEGVKEFILATDSDGPGQVLAHDLASILGPERCRFLEYPEGSKDLNEVFLTHGWQAVVKMIEAAKPFPVQGLHDFFDFPDQPPVKGMETGIDALSGKLEIVLGTLTVFTGYSNMGKSTVLNTMIAHCAAHDVPVCIASFETQTRPILLDGITKALIGCPPSEFYNHPQRRDAYAHVNKMVKVISNSLDEDLEFSIDSFLDTARIAVIRDGCKVVILDPWNEIEHKRGRDETVTEYIGRALRRIKAFIRQYNVSFWIVAHPTKPIKGTNALPSLYDISDSAHWANKADYGLVYHRPDREVNQADLAVVKVRMGLPGEVSSAQVQFDYRTSRIAAI
ncbi:toprim domain-containing protein [Sphingobium sp. AN558]|uniref:toprim domain-containing protein n=1 Tax=Sphingobium sp. AN558 TaxID=3133442 RepID=UPI0030BC5788